MKQFVLALLFLVAMTSIVAPPAKAADCDGNACSAVSVSFESGCYRVTNSGSRDVRVELRPFGGVASSISKVLKPGESWTPIAAFTNACLKGYVSPYHANFQ